MKLLRSTLVVIAVIGMAALFLAVPFAVNGYSMCGKCDEGKSGKDMKGYCEAKIKTLRDSAAALQTSNPELAKGLNDLADQKAKKMQEWTERKATYDAKAKLLTDSAAALEKANPSLSKELKDMSERKHAEKKWDKKECKDDDKD